jgi:hypothetical protein
MTNIIDQMAYKNRNLTTYSSGTGKPRQGAGQFGVCGRNCVSQCWCLPAVSPHGHTDGGRDEHTLSPSFVNWFMKAKLLGHLPKTLPPNATTWRLDFNI